MNEKKARLIRSVAGALTSVALGAAAVCLIVACTAIYRSGDAPFTPESIGAQYSKIAVPLWIAVCAVAASAVIEIFLPVRKPRRVKTDSTEIRLEHLRKSITPLPDYLELSGEIRRIRRSRMMMRIYFAILSLAVFIPTVITLCDYPSFTVENLGTAIIGVALRLVGGAVAAFILLCVHSSIEKRSLALETEKTKIAISGLPDASPAESVPSRKSSLPTLRAALIGLSVLFIVIGFFNGGFNDVLQKAVRICTECIGLG